MRLTEKTEYGSFWTKNSKGVRETLLFKEEIMKLGQYEDVDESPEYLAKVKKALEIVKEKKVDTEKLWLLANAYAYNNFGKVHVIPLTDDEFDLLTEVLS